MAREVGGKVVEVERLFPHRATPAMNERFEGRVVKKRVAQGSKRDHLAVVLETGAGSLVLRRQGGNPFWDEELAPLEGRQIECDGLLRGSQLIMTRWRVLD